jgi:hypothetical protein
MTLRWLGTLDEHFNNRSENDQAALAAEFRPAAAPAAWALHEGMHSDRRLAGRLTLHVRGIEMATATVRSTTVGVFATREAAERAIADLKRAGYRDDQIGLVGKNADGKTVKTDGAGDTHAGEGAAIGAATGAGAAALVSLGMSFGVIPVIGPILAVGPLAAALISAAGGAAAAGIAGALIGWGIPEEDAKYYEGEVKAGRYLVTVDRGDRADDARGVFTRHGGYDRSSAPTV